MKKKFLALFLGVLTVISCFGAAALKLDTAEAELFMVTDDDELLYSPADKYGNLVGSISFDNGNGNTDGASFAPYLVSTSAVSATIDYVADPSGVRDGYVLKYTSPASTVNRLGISAADNAALGKYALAFDVYLPAGSSDFAFMRADISAAQVNDFASKVNGTKGTWISCYLDFEIIEINGSTYTISYNG